MALLENTAQEYYDGNDFGNYQFVSLADVINQFMLIYVGEDKIIPKAKRLDVAFHAQRALAELSFDTLRSCKSQEVEVPASLQMTLPQDYVNYTKIAWVDSDGIKHRLYPTLCNTSNPSSKPLQDSNGDFILQAVGTLNKKFAYIVLDDEYKDIVVGMRIVGPYIPDNTVVVYTTNASGITTVGMGDGTVWPTTQTAVRPTESNAGTTLTFRNADGSLILPQKESFIVENLDWNITDFKITANAAADITDIKIGMIISHDYFPVGTTVTNVYDTTIVTSNLPDTAVDTNGGEVTFISSDLHGVRGTGIDAKDTTTWANYKSESPSENNVNSYLDYRNDEWWPNEGRRYGLEPSHSQVNGSFYIDCTLGKIHFSSNVSGKTVVLDYISDSLGTEDEMKVHKFAEEAMYKSIAYAIASGKINTPEYIVQRLKKERFSAIRTAKLRLSNLKIEELTQILRGKSKWIKH